MAKTRKSQASAKPSGVVNAKPRAPRKPRAKKGKAAGYGSPAVGQQYLDDAGACEGSWVAPIEGTVVLAAPDNGYQETGVCFSCGTRQRLTAGGDEVVLHTADREVMA
jgi:hypothetical protein